MYSCGSMQWVKREKNSYRIYERARTHEKQHTGGMHGSLHERTNHPRLAKFLKFLDTVFTDISDPFRSLDALLETNTTARDINGYNELLFPDSSVERLLERIERADKEQWLDIGSGLSFTHPLSLFNVARLLNPSLTVSGVDLAYAGKENLSEKLFEYDRIIAEGKKHFSLIAASAQDIPFEDASVDVVLSTWVFDKFNFENGSHLQALREVARVAKSEAEVRIFPFSTQWLSEPVVERYFEVLAVEESDLTSGTQYIDSQYARLVVLKRKDVPDELLEEVKKNSAYWLQHHSK